MRTFSITFYSLLFVWILMLALSCAKRSVTADTQTDPSLSQSAQSPEAKPTSAAVSSAESPNRLIVWAFQVYCPLKSRNDMPWLPEDVEFSLELKDAQTNQTVAYTNAGTTSENHQMIRQSTTYKKTNGESAASPQASKDPTYRGVLPLFDVESDIILTRYAFSNEVTRPPHLVLKNFSSELVLEMSTTIPSNLLSNGAAQIQTEIKTLKANSTDLWAEDDEGRNILVSIQEAFENPNLSQVFSPETGSLPIKMGLCDVSLDAEVWPAQLVEKFQ